MGNKNIYFPKSKKSYGGYYDKAMRKFFNTKTEKREYMNRHGLHEDGSMESDRHRTDRIAEEINADRNKQGLKSKTVKELVGNARPVAEKTIIDMGRR